MRPRVLHRSILWLLPLLVARLCVPVGFMVSDTSDGLQVMLCPAYAALPGPAAADTSHAHHAGMDHSAHATHGGDVGHASHEGSTSHEVSQSLCPFAAAGGAMLVATASYADALFVLTDVAPLFRDDPEWVSPAVLTDRIRGPPLV